MRILPPTYCDRLIRHASASFANLVQTGEMIEDGLKTGKIKHYQTLFEQNSNDIGGSTKETFQTGKMERMKRRFVPFSNRKYVYSKTFWVFF